MLPRVSQMSKHLHLVGEYRHTIFGQVEIETELSDITVSKSLQGWIESSGKVSEPFHSTTVGFPEEQRHS